MNAGLLDMLHDARDEDVLAIAQAVHVDLDGVRQIAVEEQRILAEHRVDLARLVVGVAGLHLGGDEAGEGVEQIVLQGALVADDGHGPAAQHIGGTHHQGQAQFSRDDAGLLDRIGDAVLGLLQAEPLQQALEAVAVFGQINGVDGGAENRDARFLQGVGELQRGLAAELHDDADQFSVLLFLVQDFKHVLLGQRLEIEAVRGVVVGGDRLGIAVDHDRLEPGVRERETGVAAAIVELDALADAVRPAAENDDLAIVGGARLAGRSADERRLIGRIHISGGRSEFRRAGVDALEHRTHVEPVTQGAHLVLGLARERGEAHVGKACRFQHAQARRIARQAMLADLVFEVHDLLEASDEPWVDLAGFEDLLAAHAHAQGLADDQQAVGGLLAEAGAQHVPVIAHAQPLDLDLVETIEAGFQRAQGLL